MPARKIPCEWCGRKFWASRSDSKWCSHKCRHAYRQENAKFEYPVIPRSGIPGITFNRRLKRWAATAWLRDEKRQKYLGTFKTIPEAYSFLQIVMGKGEGDYRGRGKG